MILSDYGIQKRDGTKEHQPRPGRELRRSTRPLRSSRSLLLLLLAMFGLHLFAVGQGSTSRTTPLVQSVHCPTRNRIQVTFGEQELQSFFYAT